MHFPLSSNLWINTNEKNTTCITKFYLRKMASVLRFELTEN